MAASIAIYTRVSREDAEEPASTRRQERACREIAKSNGWHVADVWEDIDVSAYQRDVRRPAFEDLMRVVAGGRVNGVLVWKLDRLVRRAADFERFWERCDSAGVFLASATEPIDSTTELGLAVIRILVNFANVESTSISLRIRAKMQEKARAGVPLWPERVFGHTKDGTEVVEEEAALIREAADRVLAGESALAITADWRRRKIPTTKGGLWQLGNLTKLLRNPRLVGDNTFKGEVVARGCFPPILNPLVHSQVRAILANPWRHRNRAFPYLLSGLLRCSQCGSRLFGATRSRRMASGDMITNPGYRCPSRPSGCAGVSVQAAFVEDLVTRTVLYRLEKRRRKFPIATAPPDASVRLSAAYDRYAVALERLVADYYVERRLTRAEWISARDGLEHQLSVARRHFDPRWKLAPVSSSSAVLSIRSRWKALDRAHQRDIIASELEFATLDPCTLDGMFDPARVRPTWWDDEPGLSSKAPWPGKRSARVDAWSGDSWMKTTEIMSVFDLSYSAVGRRVRAGQLHVIRLGNNYRFSRRDITSVARRVVGGLTTEQAAARLGVPKHCITAWVRDHNLPAFKLGQRYYLQPVELDAWCSELRRLMGVKDVAIQLHLAPATVYRMIRDGKLHCLKRGRSIRLDRDEVSKLAASLTEEREGEGDSTAGTMEARVLLGCSRNRVYRMIQLGQLSASRGPHGFRIDRQSIVASFNELAVQRGETQ